jgi:ribonuclease HI
MAINEVIIAEGKGPAEGHPDLVESFRAEAYGLASASAFVKLMIQHLETNTDRCILFCHIDNKALIKRMEDYLSGKTSSKWAELPNADIILTVHSYLQGCKVQYEHIKSHQDTSKSTASFPAKLNEIADALASKAQQQMKQPRLDVSLPFKHLKIRDMVVTKEIQRVILQTASRIPLQQYYYEKYNWTNHIFEGIHWELQYKVLTSYDINDQRRIIKFVHNWLPTNKRLHREKSSATQRCPLCHYLVEDECHLFICRHPKQQAEMQKLQSRISKELKINEEMKNLITSIIPASAKDSNWHPPTAGPEMQKGLSAQARIGWFQIANGRMAKEFILCLSAVGESINPKASAEMHGRKLIRAIWDSFLQLWKQRNEAVHGVTELTKKEAQSQVMALKVQRCYELQYVMPINDRQKLFQISEEERLKEDPQKLRAWIKLAERLIKTNKREQQDKRGSQRIMMDQYFKWHPPDQRGHHKTMERKHHRKHDLKPD